MEYKNLLDVLYNTLYFIPNAIVDTLIFKYVVNSNKYEYKYHIPYTKSLFNMYYNKQLNIICCECGTKFVFIDYLTGEHHDNSLIDVISFNSHMMHGNHGTTYSMLYFNNMDLIMRNHNNILCKYVLIDKIYKLILMCTDENMNRHNHITVCDNYIYTISWNRSQYWLCTRDLNFTKIKESRKYDCCSLKNTMISIFNETIYVYMPDYCYTHNINDFDQYHTYASSLTYSTIKLYKDKIYCYHNAQILIYDFITSEQIHCIDVKSTNDNDYKLLISDGILALYDWNHVMFYNIK